MAASKISREEFLNGVRRESGGFYNSGPMDAKVERRENEEWGERIALDTPIVRHSTDPIRGVGRDIDPQRKENIEEREFRNRR